MEVLQESRCNGVIVKRELIDEADFIRKVGYMMTVNRMLIRAPIARIEVDMPFYTGTVRAMCMKDPLFDLIIGNASGAWKPNDPNSEWEVVAVVVTRAQVRECGNPKPLKVKEVTLKIAVDKEKLVRLQEDSMLRKFKEAKETETRKGCRIFYKRRGGI